MKKSFLITLAAVSSVALIGCSSSSDDNNGGQDGGKTTINLTSATASSLGSNNTFVGVKVSVEGTKTVDGKEEAIAPADTTLSLTCGEDNIIDDTKDHVAIKKANLSGDCTLSVKAGETSKNVELDKTESTYENLPTVTVVPADPAGGKFENGVLDVTKPKDGAAIQTYTVTANKAGTLNVNAADKTVEYKAGDAITDLTIDKKAGEEGNKLNDIFAKADNGFTLDLTHASLTADIKGAIIEVSKATDLTPAKEITVNITVEKDGSGEGENELNVKPVDKVAKISKIVAVEISGDMSAYASVACSNFGQSQDKEVIIDSNDNLKDSKVIVAAKVEDITEGNSTTTCTFTAAAGRDNKEVTVDFAPAKTAAEANVKVVTLSSAAITRAGSDVTDGITLGTSGNGQDITVTKGDLIVFSSTGKTNLTEANAAATIEKVYATDTAPATASADKFFLGNENLNTNTKTDANCVLKSDATCTFKIKGKAATTTPAKLVFGAATLDAKTTVQTVDVTVQ